MYKYIDLVYLINSKVIKDEIVYSSKSLNYVSYNLLLITLLINNIVLIFS